MIILGVGHGDRLPYVLKMAFEIIKLDQKATVKFEFNDVIFFIDYESDYESANNYYTLSRIYGKASQK